MICDFLSRALPRQSFDDSEKNWYLKCNIFWVVGPQSSKVKTSVTNAIYPPFVSDSEISGRGPARQRLYEIARSSYSINGLYHVVANNFLNSKAQTLFFLCWKKADNLVCLLFSFFLFESGTSDKCVDLLKPNR